MDGACGAARRLGCTASPPLQERPGAAAAAEGMRHGQNSHPAAGKRAQLLCLAAPTASVLEDCRNEPRRYCDAIYFKHLQIFTYGRLTQDARTQFTMQTKAGRVD